MFIHSLGLGLAISWMWLFYLEGPLLIPLCNLWDASPVILLQWFLGAQALTYIILAKGFKIRSLLDKKLPLITCSIVLALCPLLTAILPVIFPRNFNPLTAHVLALFGGVATAFLYTAWMETIAKNNLRQNCMMIGIAFLLSGSIAILGQIINYSWLLPLLILSSPISLALMLRQIPDNCSLLNDYPRIDSIRLFPMRLILLLGLIYINGGIMLNIICLNQSYTYIFCLSYLAYALFCPLAGFILYRYENIDLRSFYRIILPLMFIGFSVFCFQESSMNTTALILLQGASALLNMYTWLLFPYFARFSTRPASACALGLAMMTLPVFAGNIIIDLLSTLFLGDHSVRNIAFIACIASALTIALFPDKKETFSGWEAIYKPELQTLEPEQSQSSISKLKDSGARNSLDDLPLLSSREKEVLHLLCKGRSSRFISEALNISNNTVKFHTRNIYNKLSINNRQDLLTLFETKEHNDVC